MAGLFDPTMFDPSSFGGSQAGLLARLAGMAAYRPTPQSVLPGQPGTDAMASGIMPSQGPQAAQSGAPMAQPQGVAPMGANSGLLSSLFGNKDGSGFLNGLHNALQAHQGQLMGAAQLVGSGGLNQGALTQGMNQDYQRNMQQSTLAATYKSLLDANIPPAQAQAMTLNPELLKTLAPQHFAKPVWGDIGPDPITGLQKKGWIDSNTRQVTDAAGQPIGGGGSSADTGPGLSGDEYLATLPAGAAARVKAIVEGREAPPPGGSRAPQAQAMLNMAAQYEPGFDFTKWSQRNATAKDFGSGGKSAQNVASFNTTIQHLDRLDKSIDGLDNNTLLPWANAPLNAIAGQVSPQFQAARAKFEDDKQAAASELTRAFRGTGGALGDVIGWENKLNASSSPVELHAAVKEAVQLLRGRIEAVSDNYNRGMNTNRDPLSLVSPGAADAIKRLSGEEKQSAGPTQPTAGIVHWERGPDGKPRMVKQ